jgi:hypothetical protein
MTFEFLARVLYRVPEKRGSNRWVCRLPLKIFYGGYVREADLISAAQEFLRLTSEYEDTQSNFDLMRAVIERDKLDPTNVRDLSRAWQTVRAIQRNDQRPSQAPAPQAPPVVQAPVSPTPEPPVDEVTASAQALIAKHGGVSGFKVFFDGLTAKQMEVEMRSMIFQRAVETCFPEVGPELLTRGDYVRAAQNVRAAEISGGDIHATQQAIAESRDRVAQAYANYQERAPRAEGGIPHWGPSFGNRQTATPGRKTMTADEARANELANAARSGQPETPRADAARDAAKARRDEVERRWRA